MMWNVLLCAGVITKSMSYSIFDREAARPKIPYVSVQWGTKKEADRELQQLLRGFPMDHEWRRRLFVSPFEKAKNRVSKSNVGRFINKDEEKDAGDPRRGPGPGDRDLRATAR